MKNFFPWLLAGLLLSLGVILYIKLSSHKPEQKRFSKPPLAKSVKVRIAELGPIRPLIYGLGQVRSEHPIPISAEVGGKLLPTKIKFKAGNSFAKGTTLIRIDDRQAKLNFKSAISDLMTAMANVLPELKSDLPEAFPKWEHFFEKLKFSYLPQLPEADSSKEKLYMSRFNVYKLYFAADKFKIALEKHKIQAPFNGTITASNIRYDRNISPTMVLGEIVRLDKMEIEFPISRVDAKWIDKSKPVTLTISGEEVNIQGSINRISKNVSRKGQTISIYVHLTGGASKKVFDGMYLQGEFMGREIINAISIPREAVYNKNTAYLLKNGELKFQNVSISHFGTDRVVVGKGISTGDTVIIEPIPDAIEGMLVKSFDGKSPQSNKRHNNSKKEKPEHRDKSGAWGKP